MCIRDGPCEPDLIRRSEPLLLTFATLVVALAESGDQLHEIDSLVYAHQLIVNRLLHYF